MKRILSCLVAACLPLTAGVAMAAGPDLTVAQIVAKNITARGGGEAWGKIQTMVWLGHIETGQQGAASFPFVLQMKRPDLTRFDIKANNQLAARIFDGTHGWNIRSAPMKRPNIQPFTTLELRTAHDGQGIDGPLLNYQARHIAITLDGVEQVDGHKAYRLTVKLPSGTSRHEWVDAKTFLTVKSDRESRNAFGMTGTVLVYYRNYHTVDGLQLPYLIESGSSTSTKHERMVIDKVLLNPSLDEKTFAKPGWSMAEQSMTRRSAAHLASQVAHPVAHDARRP